MTGIAKTKDQAQELLRLIRIDIDHKRYQNRQERLDLEGFASELEAWIERGELPKDCRGSEIYLWLTGSKSAVIGCDYGIDHREPKKLTAEEASAAYRRFMGEGVRCKKL